MNNSYNGILIHSRGSYPGLSGHVVKRFGLKDIEYGKSAWGGGLDSKAKLMKKAFRDIIELRKNKHDIKSANCIVSSGNFTTLFLLLLNKLGSIKPKRFFWLGFFFHSKKSLKILRHILPSLITSNVKIVLFSTAEVELYEHELGIPSHALLPIVYGDFNNQGVSYINSGFNAADESYYFSGGYSNRDYKSLVEAWEKMDSSLRPKLVIVASKNNRWLYSNSDSLSSLNIQVEFDQPLEVFDSLLDKSKACILPFSEDTGASGQSVSLRCLRKGKAIIANETNVIKDYVINGQTGILVKSIADDLGEVINKTESGMLDLDLMGKRSCDLFEKKFSFDAVTAILDECISAELEDWLML